MIAVLNLAISWSLLEDDDRVMISARTTITRFNTIIYSQDLGHPFSY